MDLRKILELSSVERAALRITPEQIEEPRNLHAGYTGDDNASNDRYTEENYKCHYLVAKASGNLELAETLGSLLDKLGRFMVIRRAGKAQEITHARIIDALEQNNIEGAKKAMLEDIESSRDTIMDRIIEVTASSWHLE
jgi:DNA-binding FadR family transcriptional regulator